MQKENIELRSPKVQNVIGKMPRRLVLSAILGKSPIYFLSAFGAMTAILLLVFKKNEFGL